MDYPITGGTATSGDATERWRAASRRDAFESLVREQDRNMRALAFRLLGDSASMDDVLQEAYLKAYRAYASFEGRSAPATWLYRITYNCCMDRLRSLQRERSAVGEWLTIETLSDAGREPRAVDDVGREVERRRHLAAALDGLPPTDRAAVLLVDMIGYPYREAAEVLGVPSGTLASRLHRARAALRDVLAEPGSEEER